MYLAWSHMEEAWRDTLVHKADGYWLREAADFYGLPWPEGEAAARAWRGVLHVEAVGRRGTFWATFWAIEAALSGLNEKFTIEIDSGLPYKIRREDGGTFTYEHVNRYVRTPFGLLFTVGPDSGLPDDTLDICPYRTRYWDAPAYDVDTYDATEVPAEMLPFVLYERSPGPVSVNSDEFYEGAPCLVEVVLFLSGTPYEVPVTYLLDDALAWRVDGVDTGTDKLTLSESFIVTPPGFPPSEVYQIDSGTELRLRLADGAVAPEPPVDEGVYYALVTAGQGTTLQLESSPGGGAIDLTTAGSGTFYLEVVQDPELPLGGHLLDDENDVGNDEEGGGPYPIYLYSGDLFPQVTAVLQRTLPAGVHLRVGHNPLV